MAMTTHITIDIYSDTVCPWCYLGTRYLDISMDEFEKHNPGVVFDLTWQPCLLAPESPVSAYQKKEVYTTVYGPDRADEFFRRVEAAAVPLGVEFDWSGLSGNSADSHKLLLLASELSKNKSASDSGTHASNRSTSTSPPASSSRASSLYSYPSPPRTARFDNEAAHSSSTTPGRTTTVIPDRAAGKTAVASRSVLQRLLDELFEGSFERGRDISDQEFVVSAAVAAGVASSEAEALEWLRSEEAARLLADRAARSRALGMTAVPVFVVQGKYKVGGAQKPDVLLGLFERLRREGSREVAAAS